MVEPELDIRYFEQALNERLVEINELVETGDVAAKPVELDQTRVGRLSRMDAMQAQAMSVEAKRRREGELIRIKSALKRIAKGSYGDCLECGEPINIARLKFDPSTSFCIQCAEQNQ
jgi:RNA polymerase-binding transcription factor